MKLDRFLDDLFANEEINADNVGEYARMYKITREDTPESRLLRAERDKIKRRKRKLRAIEYKGGKCVDCGYAGHHAAMEFHHVDPDQKDFIISQAFRMRWCDVVKELDKCVLVCANCHRIRHYKGS